MINPIFLAVDTDDIQVADRLLIEVGDRIGGVKFGLHFFVRHGIKVTKQTAQTGATNYRPWFLDLKFHDIPQTVAGAIRAIIPAGPDFLTVHCVGGIRMMRAASEALNGTQQPKLLGVTGLTSLETTSQTVMAHASGAYLAGLPGVVCAAQDAPILRSHFGPDFILMVPGIREHQPPNDQVRVATPVEAMQAGANFLVIGREISAAVSPREAVERILSRLTAYNLI